MAYVRLAPLALFLLATSVMFPTMKIEAADCKAVCSPLVPQSCGSSCSCVPVGPPVGFCYPTGPASVSKMINEHPKLCQTDDECMKKGSGNFCACCPNDYIDYGWCLDSASEALKGFLAMPTARAITK